MGVENKEKAKITKGEAITLLLAVFTTASMIGYEPVSKMNEIKRVRSSFSKATSAEQLGSIKNGLVALECTDKGTQLKRFYTPETPEELQKRFADGCVVKKIGKLYDRVIYPL